MAIGDYSKTTYVNGMPPALNSTRLNNNEDKVKELDTAVEEINTWQDEEKSVDTTSRIFDLTGDRAPAIPDDPAGVTYLSNFATTDGWVAYGGASLSVSDGKLIATKTGSAGTISLLRNMLPQNKLCVLMVQSDHTEGLLIRGQVAGVETTLCSFSVRAGVMEYIPFFNTFNATYFAVASVGPGAVTKDVGDRIILGFVYIGTGAYRSKLVDRAGVPWTNYGALPVPGHFGKGLQFNGAQYLQAPGPMIGTTGTIVVKVKFGSTAPAVNNVIFNNRNASLRQGIQLVQETTTGQIRIFICDVSNYQSVLIRATTPDTTNVHTIKIRFTSTTSVTTQFNDEAEKVTAITVGDYLSISTLIAGARDASNDFFTGTIYALRADSRVWTDDEIARWSRDPYSEDSGLVDAFSLDFTNLPTYADNAAAIAGNLPAGKLYKTSTGSVLVRY